MIKITFWSDFACPYCYIGEVRLQSAIRDLGIADKVDIEYKAYELDPKIPKDVVTNTAERYARKYGVPRDQADSQISQINQLGRDLGLDFDYGASNYSNTRDAHRVLKLAEQKYDRDTVEKLNFALFDAYFAKGKVLADHATLSEIAVAAGLKAADVKEVLESNLYDEEVRADELDAERHGVKGVPFFVLNGKFAIPGAISIEDFKHALSRELAKEPEEPLTKEHPHACGPKGCDLV